MQQERLRIHRVHPGRRTHGGCAENNVVGTIEVAVGTLQS